MRRRPLFLVLYLLPLIFLIVPSRVRDALEVSVGAALSRARHAFRSFPAARGVAPAPRAKIVAFRRRQLDSVGRDRGARVVQLRSGGGRFRVVIDRGGGDGVSLGDLAVLPGPGDGAESLLGFVDGLTPAYARVRTLIDPKSWWLARTPESRFVLQAAADPAQGMAVVRSEHRIALEEAMREADRMGKPTVAVTAADADPDRPVPDGLVVGRLARAPGDALSDWMVRPARSARAVLALRLRRGENPIRFSAPVASPSGGDWSPVRVTAARDAGPWRESMLVTRARGDFSIPVDAPVAHGAWLEGWVHTVAGASARVRLLGDPGFYAHVLVLAPRGGQLVNRGGGVFRGGGRTADGIVGRLVGSETVPRVGDRIVVGPHKGAGGVGLLLGEVVVAADDGGLSLRRPANPAVGAHLWVGRFARPPERFPQDEEAAP